MKQLIWEKQEMGGFGSGFQGTRKCTVEDGLTLSTTMLRREGLLRAGRASRGAFTWSYAGRVTGRLNYDIKLGDETGVLWLEYDVDGSRTQYPVRMVTTCPPFGGRRWWFLCPLRQAENQTPRRVANLHLPPGARYFGSRLAHGLTYRSSQENGQFRTLFARLAADLGTDPASVRAALRRRDWL